MRLSSILAFVAFAVVGIRAPNQVPPDGQTQRRPRPQWGALEPGRYGVGFRRVAEYAPTASERPMEYGTFVAASPGHWVC